MTPRLLLATAALVALCTVPLGAQGVPAQSAAAATGTHADSLAALAALEARLRQNPHDAAAWHRKGLLSLAMADGRQDGIVQSSEFIAMTRGADSSLRLAVHYAPDSVRYALDLMNYMLSSRLTTLHAAGWQVAKQAIAAAERVGDPRMLAEAKNAIGMVSWRRYEIFSHRPKVGNEDMVTVEYNSAAHTATTDRISTGGGGFPTSETGLGLDLRPSGGLALGASDNESLESVRFDRKRRAAADRDATRDDAQNFGGFVDYATAERMFAEALAADPESRTARRHLYMALAERDRWEELRHVAGERAERVPNDAVSRLSLALAEHRLGDEEAAARDFDRGFALFVPAERERLTRLTLIMPPKRMPGDTTTAPDSLAFAAASPAERAAITRRFWAENDPIALTAVNERRNEFYARVIHSELLWSVDELHIRGAESGMGQMYIRYGQPVVVLHTTTQLGSFTTWRYPYQTLVFNTPPGFGVGHLSPPDTNGWEWQTAVTPVFFRDPPAYVPDTVAAFVARFRAAGDSSGIYVAAALPVGRLVEGVGRGSAGVDVGFALTDSNAAIVLRDSTRMRIAAADTGVATIKAWQAIVPAGDYRYRVEGVGVANHHGARAAGRLAAAPASGFGLSGVLVAASVAPPAANPERARWTEFATVPNAGRVHRGGTVALLWETYALRADRDSTSRYRVSLSVQPASRGTLLDVATRARERVASLVGHQASLTDGRLAVSYDRQARVRAALADYLTLDLATAPPGDYVVRISVQDLATPGAAPATTSATFSVIP